MATTNGWITIGTKLDIKELEKDLKTSETRLKQYDREAEKLTSQKMKLEFDTTQIEMQLDAIQDKEQEIRATMGRVAPGGEQYQKLQTQLDDILNKEAQIGAKYEYQKGVLGDVSEKLEQTKQKQSGIKEEIDGSEKELDELYAKLGRQEAFEKAKNNAKALGDELKDITPKADFKGVKSKIDGIGKTIQGVTRKVVKWGLAIFGIRAVYSAVRQSVSAVTQANEGLGNQISFIKNVMASALEPVIRRIISLVYTLLTFVNSIVMKLTGKNLFAQASKNLAKGAGSAKEIKKQLAGFDEMEVLNDNSSSGGGGGGGFDTSGFEDINTKLMDVLNKMKEFVEKGDWAGLAKYISEGIISGLTGLVEKIKAIDWTGIGKAISDFITNIDFSGIFTALVSVFGEAILGFQDLWLAIDWPTFFKNLTKGFADAFSKISEYIKKIKWGEIGTKISDTINAIEWGQLGANILDAIWNAIQGIGELVSHIDWEALGQTLSTNLHTFMDKIITILQETDWAQVGKDMADKIIDFIKGVDWTQLGIDILTGLAEGLYAVMTLITEFFNELLNGILDLLGVHSPSTVFADIGKNLILGLVNGLKSVVQLVIDAFNTLITKIKSVFTTMKNWINTNVITPIGNFFTKLWNGIKDGVTGAYNKVKSTFSGVVDFFKGLIDKIVTKFTTLGSKVGNAIGSAFKSAINKVLGAIESILNTPIRAINGLIGKINELPGVSMSKLSTFSFPRLAKGGIVNMPGRGVMVGSAIAGERGQEGVIPLTDSQQMALLGEAIGKYITVNANITNTMNGRVISRELQKVQNESDFAFNR